MDLDDKRQLKHFYQNNMRMAIRLLFFLSLSMLVEGIVIFYLSVSRQLPDYYATNSAGFITTLTPLSEPNESSEALLPPDPPEEPEKTFSLDE